MQTNKLPTQLIKRMEKYKKKIPLGYYRITQKNQSSQMDQFYKAQEGRRARYLEVNN